MSHPVSTDTNILAASRSFRARHSQGWRSLFHVPPKNAIALAVLAGALVFLSGCAVNVDKRSYSWNYVHTESRVGAAETRIDNAHVNTSDTKTDAEQAIDGELSLPLLP